MTKAFTPQESTEYTGYFIVPGYSEILMARDSTIISVKDGRELRQSRPIPNSYRWIKVYSDDEGRYVNQSVHVLVALAFRGLPPRDVKSIPNHLDGNKLNNHETNIEWTTYSGNITHAYKTGLRTDNKYVLGKDLETGEIKEWYSLGECGRQFGVKAERVWDWCRKRNVYKGSWVFKYKEDSRPWPAIAWTKDYRNKFDKRPVVGFNPTLDVVVIGTSVSEACRMAGIPDSGVRRQLTLGKIANRLGWYFKYKNDPREFPE